MGYMTEHERYPPVTPAWLYKLDTYTRTAKQWSDMPGDNRPIVERAWMEGLAMLLEEARVIIARRILSDD